MGNNIFPDKVLTISKQPFHLRPIQFYRHQFFQFTRQNFINMQCQNSSMPLLIGFMIASY
jgi:hypothetical protein